MNSRLLVRRTARWITAPSRALLPFALLPCALAAQERLAQAPLDTVVVTATRIPQPVQDVVGDVSVITQEQISRAGQSSLRDVLQHLPGVQLSTNGSYASTTSLFLRGADLGKVVVLVDGVRIGSSTLGTAPIENLPLAQIDRIEVLRGPATTLYGADAVGGVIQIFTKRGKPGLQYNADAGAGSDGLFKAGAGFSGATQNFNYALSVSGERADGISTRTNPADFEFNPDDDGFRRTGVSGSLGWTLAPGHTLSTSVLASRLRHDFDGTFFDPVTFSSPLGLTGLDTDAQARSSTLAWGVTLDDRISDRWLSSLRASLSEDKSKAIYRRMADGALDGQDRFDTERRQYTWQNTFSFGPDRLIGSLERMEERVDSTVAFTVDERDTNSAMLAYTLDRGRWIGQAAGRYDDNSQFGSFTTGSLALGYRITPHWRVTGSVASNFQAPTFNQLFYPGFGNPELEPQRNRGQEAALKYDDGRLSGSLTIYRNRIRGFIDPLTNVQTSRANLEGATLEAGWRGPQWGISGSLDVLDADEEPSGRKLVRRADHSAQVRVERRADWGVAFAEALAVSDSEDEDFTSFPSRRVTLSGYGLLNIGTQLRLAPGWSMLGRINNLTDKDYSTAFLYSTLGRTLFVGLQYEGTHP